MMRSSNSYHDDDDNDNDDATASTQTESPPSSPLMITSGGDATTPFSSVPEGVYTSFSFFRSGRDSSSSLLLGGADSPTTTATTVSSLDDSTHHSTTTIPLFNKQQEGIDGRCEDDGSSSSSSSSASTSSDDTSSDEDSELAPDGPADVQFSLLSNLFFLLGATIQSIVASWEVRDAMIDAAWDAAHENTVAPTTTNTTGGWDDDDQYDDDDAYDGGFRITSDMIYQFLNSVGPFLFILNALVDARWSLYLSPTHPIHPTSILQYAWNNIKMNIKSLFGRSNSSSSNESEDSDDDDDESLDSEEEELQEEVKDRLFDLLVAVIFGLGATLEFTSTIMDNVYSSNSTSDDDSAGSTPASNMNVIAMHTYLISGILHLTKERRIVLHPFRSGSLARQLMVAGMLLFCLGSTLDCIMSYLYDPSVVGSDNEWISPVALNWSNWTSSILWNINAIFYVWADLIVFGILSSGGWCCCFCCCCNSSTRTRTIRCCRRRLTITWEDSTGDDNDEPTPIDPSSARDSLPESLSLPLLQSFNVV